MAQARGDRRRLQLLEATLRVIGTRGINAVSHRSVAEEAGVPLGSTTYYFESKQDIVVKALRFAATTEIERTESQIERLPADGMSATALADAIAEWLARQLSGRTRARTIALYSLQLEAMHRPELRPIYEEWTNATVRLASRLLEAAGSPRPAAEAPLLVAAIDGLRHNQLATRDEGVSEAIVRAVVDPLVQVVVANGLAQSHA